MGVAVHREGPVWDNVGVKKNPDTENAAEVQNVSTISNPSLQNGKRSDEMA